VSRKFLPPWLIQLIGILIVIGATIFWALTDRESITIIGVGMTLIGYGAYSATQDALKNGGEG
jgi:4-hydroxybenzoate polyprenyltransferase